MYYWHLDKNYMALYSESSTVEPEIIHLSIKDEIAKLRTEVI